MLEAILGAVIGTAASTVIAHFYYRLSARELQNEIDALRDQLANLESTVESLNGVSERLLDLAEVTRKHVTIGTTDDPEFPYK